MHPSKAVHTLRSQLLAAPLPWDRPLFTLLTTRSQLFSPAAELQAGVETPQWGLQLCPGLAGPFLFSSVLSPLQVQAQVLFCSHWSQELKDYLTWESGCVKKNQTTQQQATVIAGISVSHPEREPPLSRQTAWPKGGAISSRPPGLTGGVFVLQITTPDSVASVNLFLKRILLDLAVFLVPWKQPFTTELSPPPLRIQRTLSTCLDRDY